jgi:hypothetical protein
MQPNNNPGNPGQQQNQQQNLNQQQNQQQAAYQFHLALKAYFYNQGQSIHKLRGLLDSNILAHGFRYTVSVLLEILMYVFAMAALIILFMSPSNPLEFSQELDNGDQFSAEYTNDDLVATILFVKIILFFVLVMPSVFCGILLNRNRSKSSKIRKAYEEAEQMKTNFDKALRDFNL